MRPIRPISAPPGQPNLPGPAASTCPSPAGGGAAAPCRWRLRPAALQTAASLMLLPALLQTVVSQTTGQRTTPNIGYIYPAGGQRGTTVTVSVGGERLNGTSTAHSSIPGAQLKVAGYDRPLSQKEIMDGREQMQKLQEKRAAVRAAEKAAQPGAAKPTWTADDERALQAVRTRLAKRPARLANPAIAETVTLQITLPPEARAGDYELRVLSPAGLSNPIVFQIGDLVESVDTVVTSSTNLPGLTPGREPVVRNLTERTAREVILPTVVNGQILPGEVDRIRFTAKKGQRLTIAVAARALIPYLADAVPGWFQATLALHDPAGREVAYDDDYRFNPDPVLAYQIPADGKYTIEIKDSIYRGREDFVYRIAIGELPYVTGIFPLGSAPQPQTTFDLAGWNLPSEKLTIPADNRPSGTFLLAVRNSGHLSNSVRFAIDGQPETMETAQPNNSAAEAQPLTLPAIVNGRVEMPGDNDYYSFVGTAGQEITAEVLARRLNSPLDSVLEIIDPQGKRLAFNDDFEDKGSGLITHHADSRVMVRLPAEGRYLLRIADTQHRGGPEFAYRLRIGPPQPDFELRIVPSTINVRASANTPVTIYALRRDGYNGEILLGLKDAPRGFFLSGGRIPAGQDKIQLTLTAPPAPLDQPCDLRVIGVGKIGAREVVRTAVPADDMMQAFLYRHLVTARELKVAVLGRGSPSRLMAQMPLKITAGGEARLQVAAIAARNASGVRLELNEPPEGITVKQTRSTRDGYEVTFACDATKVKPGLQGNLILNAFAERAGTKATKATKQGQRSPLGTLPAIPFEIVASNKPSVAGSD